MSEIIVKYEILIFATPIYWYNMSGIMKVFFDRFTDLMKIEKPLCRKLNGKKMAAISCSNEEIFNESFWIPFRETADYLRMEYLGNLHVQVSNNNIPENELKKLAEFAGKIN